MQFRFKLANVLINLKLKTLKRLAPSQNIPLTKKILVSYDRSDDISIWYIIHSIELEL